TSLRSVDLPLARGRWARSRGCGTGGGLALANRSLLGKSVVASPLQGESQPLPQAAGQEGVCRTSHHRCIDAVGCANCQCKIAERFLNALYFSTPSSFSRMCRQCDPGQYTRRHCSHTENSLCVRAT